MLGVPRLYRGMWLGLLLIFLGGWPEGNCQPTGPRLSNLLLSHGYLDFKPDVLEYTLPLSAHFQTLEVVPILDSAAHEGKDHPLIHVGIGVGSMDKVLSGIGASLDIRSYRGSSFQTIVEVSDTASGEYTQYKLLFDESDAVPTTALETLVVTDQDGDKLELSGSLSSQVPKDQQVYIVYAQTKTEIMTFTGTCEDGSTLLVDDSTSGRVARDIQKANQLVTVECRKDFNGKRFARMYFFNIRTQFNDLPPPAKLIVQESGKVCKFATDDPPRFYCESDRSKASFMATIDPRFRYTIVNSDSTVKMRLLNNEPSGAVPLNSGLYVHGTAGHTSKKWPLVMNGAFFPAGGDAGMQVMGWILGVMLLLAIGTLLFVLGLSNVFGMGSPFGASEVPSTVMFLLQYFCFANAIRGSPTVLADMTTVLKYTTLWWPLPWQSEGEVSVAHVENAQGCLFWCMLLFVGCLLLHGLVWIKFKMFESGYTYPHKMLLGHWESRAIHFLVFPATVASLMLLCHPDSSAGGRVLGAFVFLGIAGWTVLSFFVVKRAVKSRSVLWIWNHSLREEEEIESGFWTDAECNQLHTEPTNRSLCRTLFPWRWVSTVADIDPVAVLGTSSTPAGKSAGSAGTTVEDADDSVLSAGPPPLPESFRAYGASAAGDVVQGKTARNVEVYATRAPNRFCCKGQKLVAGLFRTQWLDLLFTYDALTNFYSYSEEHGVRTQIPLTVKTHQLAGPLSQGYLCFYFDGVRIPFVRTGEFAFRVIVGLMLGIVLASSAGWLDGLCFLFIAGLAGAALFYAAVSNPFSRRVENWLLAGMLITVALSAIGFMGVSFAGKPNLFLDILLWFMMLVCISLSIYSIFITFCIISAVLCPPMEEYRFLERLCNTDIVMSDHMEGFRTEAMGYNRYGTRDVMVQCSIDRKTNELQIEGFPGKEDATIELPVSDVIAACRSGQLPAPKVCLTITSKNDPLGYGHLNLYDRYNTRSQISSFVAPEAASAAHMERLTEFLQRQIDTRSHDTAVIALTVILPKASGAKSSAEWAKSRGASLPTDDGTSGGTTGAKTGSHAGYSMPSGTSRSGSRRGYTRISGEDRTSGQQSGHATAMRTRTAGGYSQVELRSQRDY